MTSVFAYIFVMAGVTYLVRVIPFAFFTKKIRSKYIKNMLYYMPYAVLAAMTIPAIFASTDSTLTAIVGTVTALAAAYAELPLIVVALAAAAAVFLTGMFL